MATLKQKIEAETKMRDLLASEGMPAPDEVEYGYTCVRLFWHEPKACVIVQIDEPPPGWKFAEELVDGTEDGTM